MVAFVHREGPASKQTPELSASSPSRGRHSRLCNFNVKSAPFVVPRRHLCFDSLVAFVHKPARSVRLWGAAASLASVHTPPSASPFPLRSASPPMRACCTEVRTRPRVVCGRMVWTVGDFPLRPERELGPTLFEGKVLWRSGGTLPRTVILATENPQDRSQEACVPHFTSSLSATRGWERAWPARSGGSCSIVAHCLVTRAWV